MFCQPGPDGSMNLLGLLRGGGLAGPDDPHRLIGQHNTAPVTHLDRYSPKITQFM